MSDKYLPHYKLYELMMQPDTTNWTCPACNHENEDFNPDIHTECENCPYEHKYEVEDS